MFSNIIKKANLNSDMQACREMNMALAEEQNVEGKPTSIERVMRILADHGYDAQNWQPLSADYKYLWDSELNQMILVLKEDGTIVFPDAEGYADKGISAVTYGAGLRFQEYNQNVIAALDTSFSFNSSNTSTEKVTLSSGSSSLTQTQNLIANAIGGSSNQQLAGLKSALGISGSSAYIAASSEQRSSTSGTYASCESLYVTDDASVVITADLLSTGEYKPNTYVISVKYAENATNEEKIEAQKAAGEMVYSLFVQMNSDVIDDSASIVIPAGTVIDCSAHEWRAAKSITGYFGSSDPSNPAIIDGLKLSTDTGYAQTYTLAGSGSQYFITGFIGAVYGTATVENLTFRNVTINSPGADYQVASEKANRNTVGIIGGIIPDPATSLSTGAVNVTIRNIKVEESVSILGTASVGGIVGYIGAEEGYAKMSGVVNIFGCSFAGSVESSDSRYIADGYSPVGGIIGFNCRCTDGLTINVDSCSFTGSAKGYGKVGGVIGDFMAGPTLKITKTTSTGTETNLGNCTSRYKKDNKTETNYANYGALGKVVGNVGAAGISVDSATVSNSGLTAANAKGSGNFAIVGLS